MPLTIRRSARPALATLAALALAAIGLPQAPIAAAAAAAQTRTVTLVGSLQSELGCSDDWQPACEQTRLVAEPGTSTYQRTFDVPAGSYEVKTAINGTWEESYALDGTKGGDNAPLVLKGPARLQVTYDDTTHRTGIAPLGLAGGATTADKALAQDSLRPPTTRERFYFVMADRFANGDRGNDQGGLTGGRLETGLDPSDKGFYHGGDLAGLQQRLDYVKGLGTTAIWLTPSFKNRPVQGTGADASAGYHGYWVTDFTQIDPHLGTNAEMKALVAAAHAKGMKVYFDIITNHTADVLDYAQKQYSYVPKSAVPYRTAAGQAFDDRDYVNKQFPPLSAQSSFPYTPTYRTEADKTVRVPSWLNDPTMYHNRGDSTWAGESTTYGDFVGLDDLFTERPEVVDGMGDVYAAWVDLGIDGFRIDTVKHVNLEFWQRFSPRVLDHARSIGRKDFFMFGEVYDGDPKVTSTYTTAGKLPATLDFGFQGAAVAAAQGKATTGLRDLFAGDDYYTDADSNAYQLPTFLGNHDMGRVGMMLAKAGYTGGELLQRTRLANEIMYLTRGQPVTYYGDEQGFAGAGGDKDSRQDMFATKVQQYAEEPVIGGAPGSRDRYDRSAPLYRTISELSALRQANPALADGAQIHRYASDAAGIYAFSRIDRATGREYVVAVNNSTKAASASFSTYVRQRPFLPVHGTRSTLKSDKDGRVTATVPPLSVSVWSSTGSMTHRPAAPAVYLTSPGAGATVGGRAEISAAIPENTFAQVTFAYRPVGTSSWTTLGTDDNAPYRVFHDVSGLAKGTLLEYRAVAKDGTGNVSASSSYGIVGEPGTAPTPGGGVGPVTQPQAVSVPGTHNTEMGCSEDWAPACDQAQLALDAKDQVWKRTFTTIPAGQHSYKAAINRAWDENYGAGGVRGGTNIDYTAPGGNVTFYYDHATHHATSDAQGPIITAPGSYQAKLGCGGDWAPDCMRPWLQDPDGDGTYTWSSDQIPAGTYEFKVAHGLSWTESYGAGGAAGGSNMPLTVPSDGTVVTISYTIGTHMTTVKTSRAGSAPDLGTQRAVWVAPDLMAWPAAAVPQGTDPALLRWRLHWSPSARLAMDAETITSPDGGQASLTRDPAGLPAAVLAAHPELEGYHALRLDRAASRQAPEILRGQVAVGMYDHLGRLQDATGVQTAPVIDALYAPRATARSYGVSFRGATPSFAVWAPTAQQVTLLSWPRGAAAEAPVSAATRTRMDRGQDGAWTATRPGLKDARYAYEVVVYAPTTRTIETNVVTDPYSVALTPGSARSVAVDLADPALAPRLWRDTRAPALKQSVDSTIYELHVRDFSIGDASVPAAHRGSYLAFADEGDGTKHLRSLAKAGLNTVHLLPTFDIASIPEGRADQQAPGCDLASMGPASEGQQACITKVADKDGYNWGYDPLHWMAPEGSYASSDASADGGARVAEFRTMVGGLHRSGLRVVLDQVFNHTPASGQDPKSVLDRIVPGYYHRLDAKGAVYTSTCCQNIATEHAMAEKAMVDAVVLWARHYKVDGFRFDLMGHHSRESMVKVRSALDALTPARDGVDGRSVYVYGEGWNFGEVADDALFRQATQGQLGGTGIGAFNDRLRDAVRGGGPFDDDPRAQGFGSGVATAPNGTPVAGGAADLANDTDLLQLGLAGQLRSFSFRSTRGTTVTGEQVDYNGAKAGYADQPAESISYVDAHDNETLWDALTMKLPRSTSMADRVRMNTLSLSTTALGQSPSFWHAGADLLRSKSFDRDSYNSGDWFNTLSWTGADNGFGHGLPPAGPNKAKWEFMRPLLADASLKPSAADVRTATTQAQDLLRLRFSTPLFRLGTADQIRAKLSYPVSGTTDARPGVVVMRIDDTRGTAVDPALDGVVVVFNATPEAVSQPLPGLKGATMTLSPVQQQGADAVVRQSRWDAATGVATVPARTVAVFVQPAR